MNPIVEQKRHAVKDAEHRRERRAPETEQEHPASDRTDFRADAIGEEGRDLTSG